MYTHIQMVMLFFFFIIIIIIVSNYFSWTASFALALFQFELNTGGVYNFEFKRKKVFSKLCEEWQTLEKYIFVNGLMQKNSIRIFPVVKQSFKGNFIEFDFFENISEKQKWNFLESNTASNVLQQNLETRKMCITYPMTQPITL